MLPEAPCGLCRIGTFGHRLRGSVPPSPPHPHTPPAVTFWGNPLSGSGGGNGFKTIGPCLKVTWWSPEGWAGGGERRGFSGASPGMTPSFPRRDTPAAAGSACPHRALPKAREGARGGISGRNEGTRWKSARNARKQQSCRNTDSGVPSGGLVYFIFFTPPRLSSVPPL